MNFILLFFSVCVFCSLLEKLGVNVNIINKLVLLLIFNTIVKHFFYSAHEQMFVFLSPLLIFYVLYFKIVLPQKRDNFLITLLFGIACLAYGSFVLYLPCLVLLFMMMDKNAKTIFSKWETYGLHIMLFVFPTVLWIFLCRKFSGHYYNREIEKFREIVWMQDAWSVSLKTFLKMLSMNMLHFLFISLRAILPFALIYFFLKRKNVSEHPSDSLSFNTVVAVCVIVFTLFFSLLGYYAYRLCFFISILFIIAIAKELSRLYQQYPENGKLYDRRLSISIAVWCLLNFVM